MVFSGLSAAWRLASWPTNRSPVLVKATTDGVVRLPSLLIITVGLPPSITATTEFVVPKSIPTAFAITNLQNDKDEKTHDRRLEERRGSADRAASGHASTE